MSGELKEALADAEKEAERVDSSLRDLRAAIEQARIHEDEPEELRKKVESLEDAVENLDNENEELTAQLEVLKKNLPAAERELTLWRLQRK